MNNKHHVSIILPTYNQHEFLGAAIKSVLHQTISHWELIIVNNNSQDKTVEVVNSFKDSRITLYNFSNEGIIAKSRNYGVKKASSEIIAFLDSDDTWDSKKLETCINELINKKVDLVCHGEIWNFNGKKFIKVFYNANIKNIKKTLLFRGNRLSTSAVVLKRKAFDEVGGFSEELEIVTSEDYDLWIKLSFRQKKFYFINKILGTYFIHKDGNSRKIIKARLATYKVFKKYIRIYSKHPYFWSAVRFTQLTFSAIKEYFLQKIY